MSVQIYTMSKPDIPVQLTANQRATLAFIRQHLRRHGMPPVLAEIARALDFAHPSTAQKCLAALERKGLLERLPGKARGIRLPDGMAANDDLFLSLPVLGRVAAGAPIGSGALEGEAERHVRIDPALFHPRADYLLRVEGDSMIEDGILDGDLVGVRRQPDAEHGQTVVARIDGEVTIKRLERGRHGIRLLPRNPAYAPIEVRPDVDDFAIEGLFVGLLRIR